MEYCFRLKTGIFGPCHDIRLARKKIEEIEYASYGQKSRVVCEYVDPLDPASKVLREIEYNDRDKVTRIKKYEYNEDGSKKRQLNYYPNGKLESVKEYELIFR